MNSTGLIVNVRPSQFFPFLFINIRGEKIYWNAFRIETNPGELINLPFELYEPSNEELALVAQFFLENSIFSPVYDFSNDHFIIQIRL
jgi:hypothetical protein